MRTKILPGLAAAAVAWHLFAGIAFIRSAAPTSGEPEQLAGGYACLVTGNCLISAADNPPLAGLLARLAPVDLVLVEGFKANPHPKIEVHRPALGQPPLWPDRPDIVAVAADAPLPGCSRPVLPLNEPAAIADWALAFLHRYGAVDDKP